MSDNVTGPGVPLTTAQRVAKYGARTRPDIEGGLPMFELDPALEATYRETVLLGYEDIDSRAKKVLSDARSWVAFQIVGALGVITTITLFLLGILPQSGALGWGVVAAIIVILGFPYRRSELSKHRKLLEEAEEYLQGFFGSGKATRI